MPPEQTKKSMKTQIVRTIYRQRRFWKHLLPLQRSIRVRLPQFDLLVRLDDWAVGIRIAVNRSYEPHVTAVVQQFVQPGTVFIDIGANIGYYSLLAARLAGPSGKVIAFEPGAANCALLEQSLQINDLRNVTLKPWAVADIDGSVSYGADDSNGRIELDRRVELPGVPAVTLDTALADEPRIDFIKMDIEGAEGRALRGMQQILQRHRPIVCSEFTPAAMPSTSGMAPELYLDVWRAFGYELALIPRRGAWQPQPLSNSEIMQHFAGAPGLDHVDLLALPPPATGTKS
jgi:FkbM family methyltransferase